MIHSASAFVEARDRRGWRRDFEQWPEPYFQALGNRTRQQMCPPYIAGLIGPGDRKHPGNGGTCRCAQLRPAAAVAGMRSLSRKAGPALLDPDSRQSTPSASERPEKRWRIRRALPSCQRKARIRHQESTLRLTISPDGVATRPVANAARHGSSMSCLVEIPKYATPAFKRPRYAQARRCAPRRLPAPLGRELRRARRATPAPLR